MHTLRLWPSSSILGFQVDTLTGLMAAPNLIALALLSPVVLKLAKDYFSGKTDDPSVLRKAQINVDTDGRLAVTFRRTLRATAVVDSRGSVKRTGNGCQGELVSGGSILSPERSLDHAAVAQGKK